jgi:endonuclease YncB( thermonuclease family)
MTHRHRRAVRIGGGLLAAVLALLAAGSSTHRTPFTALPQPGLYSVSHVVDGDTIDVTQGSSRERVRLIGIDTPETKDPRKPVQCFGEAAAAKTGSLVQGKSVRLEADPADDNRDKYGRLLRYVYLPDGTFVNQVLVEQGYAFAYTVFPNSKLDQFRAWEHEARTQNRGLWAGCGVDDSSRVKQTK